MLTVGVGFGVGNCETRVGADEVVESEETMSAFVGLKRLRVDGVHTAGLLGIQARLLGSLEGLEKIGDAGIAFHCDADSY